MDQRLRLAGLLVLAACSGGAPPVVTARTPEQARASRPNAAPTRGTRASIPPPTDPRTRAVANAPLALELDEGGDRAFIDNARRAIGLYREFLARAGSDEQFAVAVKRSREQIEDLETAILFVQNGMQERARK